MAENSRIEWCDHTFNPWIGCTRVSPACDNCYAAAMARRRKWARFEPGAPRRRTKPSTWAQPLRWNRQAEAKGIRPRVFGPSLADPFDAEVSDDWRRDYVKLVEDTPNLDWILLTKRPQVAVKFFDGRKLPDNLWPGITAENQAMLELRAPAILSLQASIIVLSAEPLLGELNLWQVAVPDRWAGKYAGHGYTFNALQREDDLTLFNSPRQFGWVIAGGESGPKARPPHPLWFKSLRDQCFEAEKPFFFKQWGAWGPSSNILVNDKRTAIVGANGTAFTGPEYWKQFGARPVNEATEQLPRHAYMLRVGKKAAGAVLDGRHHREVPA